MKFSEGLISIFETEVTEHFDNSFKLFNALTGFAAENISSMFVYEQSEKEKLKVGFKNRVFLYPIILSSYAGFEFLMQQLCQLVENNFDHRSSFDPFHRFDLKSSGKFLRGNDSDFSWSINLFNDDLKKDWINLLAYQELRNAIAHYNGNFETIPINKRGKYQKVHKIEGVYLSKNGTFLLEGSLPKEYIEFLHSFIKKLLSSIKSLA